MLPTAESGRLGAGPPHPCLDLARRVVLVLKVDYAGAGGVEGEE
ncbi:hypothetical protein [Streptomyces stelliscabiei]|nr:hypothetical protein [Streptomyces stelliscabiei]MDX2661028.1 hypothetical protein [Streptomyces stelliscabiei]MDX2715895.1 hypothetical protein [Streptomyces stelliscabiei]MDX2790005.1 hypothetical protein [Streptomyces stelliscabiei]